MHLYCKGTSGFEKSLYVLSVLVSCFLRKNGILLEHARGLKVSLVFLVHVTSQSSTQILLIFFVTVQVSRSFLLSVTGTTKRFNRVFFVVNILFPLPLSALLSLSIRDIFFFPLWTEFPFSLQPSPIIHRQVIYL